MIRKLIVGLALVGTIAVGGASVVSAETSGPSGTTPSATSPSTQTAPRSVHDRRCALGNRMLNFLEKAETRQADRLAKLKAKQAELAQSDPDKAAKIGEVITRVEHRQSEVKEYADKLAAKLAQNCPAAPAAS